MSEEAIEAMADAIRKIAAVGGNSEKLASAALAAYRETPEFKGLVSERDRYKRALEIRSMELRRIEIRESRIMQILTKITMLLPPEPLTGPDGKTYVYEDPNANETLRLLRDRIRAIPIEVEKAMDEQAATERAMSALDKLAHLLRKPEYQLLAVEALPLLDEVIAEVVQLEEEQRPIFAIGSHEEYKDWKEKKEKHLQLKQTKDNPMNKLSEDVQLLPCPFCGPGQSMVSLYETDFHYWTVGCGRCGSHSGQLPASQADAKQRIIDLWNTRPYLDRIRALEAEPSEAAIEAALDAFCTTRTGGTPWRELEETKLIQPHITSKYLIREDMKAAIKAWQQQAGGK